MKVLMTADAVGGVWTYAMELTRALATRGHRTVLAVMGPPPSDAQRAQARHVDLIERPYKLEWMRDPWGDVDEAGAWLLDLEREHAPHAVHLNGYAHATLPWRAPTLVVAHSCVLSWWRAALGTAAPIGYSTYRERVARGLASAGLVIAPTRALLEELRGIYGFRTPALVIPNGLPPAPAPIRAKEPLVLAVGRVWDPAKDMLTLDAAAEGLGWAVDVVGDATHPDGGSTPSLRHARALGRVDAAALEDAYARASVFAHPARYEPFGLAPLEAAQRGCALVLSDIPTLREVWGDAALYAPPGDAQAWRRRLRALAGDARLREGLADRARARARRFTADAMAARYLDAYARLRKDPIIAKEGPASAS